MTDYTELKRLAEAFPGYDYDSNTEPFFNGPSGESLGGGSTGFYCVYGPDFEIDGDQYDGNTLVEVTTRDQAKFICEAKVAVLALIAENERVTTAWHDMKRELDQLKAENEALKSSYAEAWEKARALQSECDEFVKDAERYRVLRDECDFMDAKFMVIDIDSGNHVDDMNCLTGDKLDARIDEVKENG